MSPHTEPSRFTAGLLVLGALLACKRGEPSGTAESAQAPAATAPAASAPPAVVEPPTAAASAAPPATPSPSKSQVRTIPDECSSAWVVLTVITPKIRDAYHYGTSVQALYAHPEFVLVAGKPGQTMQVQLLEGPHGDSNVALWARCADGVTCNKLAITYRSLLPTARPWPYCGKGDTKVDQDGSHLLYASNSALADDARKRLRDDVVSQCGRIGVCAKIEQPDNEEDVGFNCQKRPSTFKLGCSGKAKCSEVMSCLGG